MDPNPRAPILLAVVAFLALAASVAAGAEEDASGISLGRRAGGFLHGLKKKDTVVDGDHGVALDEVGPGLFDALFASLSMILVSEIGDETFIIAALMAMRHPKSIVLSGALSALFVMTVLSTGLGRIVPNLISRKVTNSFATVLYLFFGLRLLYIAWKSDPKGSQKKEMEERLGTKEGEKDIYRMARIRERKTRDINQIKCIKDGVDRLLVRDEEMKDRWREYFDKLFNGEEEGPILELDDSFDDNNRRFVRRIQEAEIEQALKRMKSGKAMGPDGIPIEVEEKLESGQGKSTIRKFFARFCTPIFLEAFILTFLAEWGDRSQIATIALATHKNAIGVAVGASLGHTVCTSLAVVGGSMLASKISQRTVATIGGVLFLGFSVSSYFYPPL
ncbi:hypothetical protein PR202_gb12923 [Eleusine coracana subsp. coracana]|uniref:GDT1 family protein n=1 Tax=Eleusine coracana subsp. coracana TaxID=191504 RepID=A0AAV5ERT4_ELECO|nr:hypothetical protein PR202_gb12923 [Eleusine coracana subsp. coracana]